MAKELKDTSKTVPELRNKIILLESRVRESEHKMLQEREGYETNDLQDKLEIMAINLNEKESEISSLRAQLRSMH